MKYGFGGKAQLVRNSSLFLCLFDNLIQNGFFMANVILVFQLVASENDL